MTSFKNMLIRYYNIFAFLRLRKKIQSFKIQSFKIAPATLRLSENIQSFKTQLFKIVPASLRLSEKILSFNIPQTPVPRIHKSLQPRTYFILTLFRIIRPIPLEYRTFNMRHHDQVSTRIIA